MKGTLAPEVASGLDELADAFEHVSHEPDGVGGAYVTIARQPLGTRWSAPRASLQFHLPYNYPSAAPYPYYLPNELEPGFPFPPALQRVVWRDQPVLQISLRHNNWNPNLDSVTGCVLQVLDWIRSQ